jgi:hypothetical protein
MQANAAAEAALSKKEVADLTKTLGLLAKSTNSKTDLTEGQMGAIYEQLERADKHPELAGSKDVTALRATLQSNLVSTAVARKLTAVSRTWAIDALNRLEQKPETAGSPEANVLRSRLGELRNPPITVTDPRGVPSKGVSAAAAASVGETPADDPTPLTPDQQRAGRAAIDLTARTPPVPRRSTIEQRMQIGQSLDALQRVAPKVYDGTSTAPGAKEIHAAVKTLQARAPISPADAKNHIADDLKATATQFKNKSPTPAERDDIIALLTRMMKFAPVLRHDPPVTQLKAHAGWSGDAS